MNTNLNKTVKVSNILNKTVLNSTKQKIGKIEDIILTRDPAGEACYVILTSGGFLGVGEDSFAIPWSSIHYDTNEKDFIINVGSEQLKAAPKYDKNSWTDEFSRSVNDFYKSL